MIGLLLDLASRKSLTSRQQQRQNTLSEHMNAVVADGMIVLLVRRRRTTAVQRQTQIVRTFNRRRFKIQIDSCRDCQGRVRDKHPLHMSDAIGSEGNQLGAEAPAGDSARPVTRGPGWWMTISGGA